LNDFFSYVTRRCRSHKFTVGWNDFCFFANWQFLCCNLYGFQRSCTSDQSLNVWKFIKFIPATQTHLDKILTFFQENFRVFQKNSLANFKKFQIRVSIFIFQLATQVHAEFQLTTCYLDWLRQMFDHFSRKFQSFSGKLLTKFQKFQIWILNI
jgi:hypothetical protein